MFAQYQISAPIVIAACPSTADIVDQLDASRIAYYCADEHSELPGMDKDLVLRLERELLNKSDIVFATSRRLEVDKKKLHDNVVYFPHGVDFKHFNAALELQNEALPDDIKALKRPLIGFIGLIGIHLDMSLLDYVAKKLNNASFVMIGPIEEGMRVPKLKNIHYLGKKNYSELPYYLAHFEVCILPYAQTERNKYANPTKVREYLAAGASVVCTQQDELDSIDGDFFVATNKEKFVEYTAKVLADRYSVSRQDISSSMKNETWKARAELMINTILNSERKN